MKEYWLAVVRVDEMKGIQRGSERNEKSTVPALYMVEYSPLFPARYLLSSIGSVVLAPPN